MNFNTLAKLRNYLSIKHHVPGRIRVKFDQAIVADPDAMGYINQNTALPPGVYSMRLNKLARSVVVEYDNRLISPELIEELVRTRQEARAVEILRELDNVLSNTSAKEVN